MNLQTPNNANLEFLSHISAATTEVAGEEEVAVQSAAPWKVADSGFWGMLVPRFHGVGLTQLNFQRTLPVVMLGSAQENHIVISHEKISASSFYMYVITTQIQRPLGPHHCSFHWDEKVDNSFVFVRDHSETGTFVSRLPAIPTLRY